MAGSAQGIKAGRAYVELFADPSKLQAGLRSAQKRLEGWGKAIDQLGGKIAKLGALDLAKGMAGLGALGGAATVFSGAGAELERLSQRTGVAVEDLSALGFAAEQSGASLGDVAEALKTMQANNYGRSIADAKRWADYLSQISNRQAQVAQATRVFGAAGENLLPLLKEGSKGLERYMQEAKDAGLVMSGKDAKAALQFSQAMAKLQAQFRAVVNVVGAAVAPLLTDLLSKITPILKGIIDWVRENQGLLSSLLKLAALSVAFGAAQIALAGLVKGLGLLISVGAGVVSALGFVLTALTAILSPIGLVLAAVAGLTAAWFAFAESGQEALGLLSDLWDDLGETAKTTWGGIVDAVMSGDLALAGRIAMAGLKLAWAQVVGTMEGVWMDFKNFFVNSWQSAVYAVAGFFVQSFYGWQYIFAEVISAMGQMWNNLVAGFKLSWLNFTGFFRKAWAKIKGLFQSEDEAKAAVDAINQDLEAQHNAIVSERDQKREAIEATRAAKVGALRDEANQVLSALQSQQGAERQVRDKAKADRMKELQDEAAAGFAGAREELQRLRSQAGRKRAEQMTRLRAGVEEARDQHKGTTGGLFGEASGTFSAAVAGRLAGGKEYGAQTVEELKRSNEILAKLLGVAGQGGVFA